MNWKEYLGKMSNSELKDSCLHIDYYLSNEVVSDEMLLRLIRMYFDLDLEYCSRENK